jgi:tetratricopeptide (TPR) repeat protein
MSFTGPEAGQTASDLGDLLELLATVSISGTPADSREASGAVGHGSDIQHQQLANLMHTYSVCSVAAPDRVKVCKELSDALWECVQQRSNPLLLVVNIAVAKELVNLHPLGDPGRAECLNDLAVSLQACFQQTGDATLLSEAVKLHREALDLRPVNHPERHHSCNNLATLLRGQSEHTGDAALLDEAIQLHREALFLRPVGHPARSDTCTDLAMSLGTRFGQTGDSKLLDEAVQLHREALLLLPVGTPQRLSKCNNLAAMLAVSFQRTGKRTLLDEAAQLHREVLDSLPADHPQRATSCNNLAQTLSERFNQTRDRKLLDEAVQLHREALALRPAGHPSQAEACYNLTVALMQYLAFGGDGTLDEACFLIDGALHLCTPGHPLRPGCLLIRADLDSVFEEQGAAIAHLQDALASPTRQVVQLLQGALTAILFFNIDTMTSVDQHALLEVIKSAVGLLVIVYGSAIDFSSQLEGLRSSSVLGPRAFTVASRVGLLPTGLELLERTRGVIWSQMLQLRSPQMDRVPTDLATKLDALLQRTDSPQSSQPALNHPSQSFLTDRDVRHEQRNRLQQVLREIRSLEGLEDFMRGPEGHELLAVAARNPVVVLIAAGKECHALVIKSPLDPLTSILLDIDAESVQGLSFSALSSEPRGSFSEDKDDERGMRIARAMSPPHVILTRLWRVVVKPVLAHLQLFVSSLCLHVADRLELRLNHRRNPATNGLESTGAPQALSRLPRYTQQGSTKVPAKSAVQITWSRRTPQLLPHFCRPRGKRRRILSTR